MRELLLKARKRKGFTLIELIVVVTIIGILTVIAVPRFSDMTEKAKVSTFEANHKTYSNALLQFFLENGAVPTDVTTGDFTSYFEVTSVEDNPAGADYTWDGDELESTLTIGGKTYTRTYNPATGVSTATESP
jgi:prepilin-type N-terminal cleavage/methylation domain-containing protein